MQGTHSRHINKEFDSQTQIVYDSSSNTIAMPLTDLLKLNNGAIHLNVNLLYDSGRPSQGVHLSSASAHLHIISQISISRKHLKVNI
jgi:hypothetical protein